MPIPFEISRLDLVYDTKYREPQFALTKSVPEIVAALFPALNAINPSPRVAPSDISGGNVGTYGDTIFLVRLYRGSATIAVSAERLTVSFTGLTSPVIPTAREVLLTTTNTIAASVPSLRFGSAEIRTSSWLQIEGRERSATTLLDELARPVRLLESGSLGAAWFHSVFRTRFGTEEAGWYASVTMEKSALPEADLFWQFDLTLNETERFNDLDARMNFAVDLYRNTLANVGLVPRQSGESG